MAHWDDSRVGLALGGGVVLGAAHVGVIRALEERGIEISYLAGTSAGALVAALRAFGLGWKEMRDALAELNWLDISGVSLSRYGVLSSEKLESLLRERLGDVEFSDTEIPLAILATDVSKGRKVILKEGDVAEAVKASTCVPGVFAPVEAKGTLLVDGGVLENVPVPTIQEMGAEFTIGVDLNAKQEFRKPGNIIELLVNTINISMHNVTRLQTAEADLLIEPDLSGFSLTDTGQIPELVERGYDDACARLDKFVESHD